MIFGFRLSAFRCLFSGPSKKVLQCSRLLASKNYTIAFAESATGGRMCSEFSLTPDSGTVLKGGIICYDVSIKEEVLGVPHNLIKKYTPESAEVTQSLAERSREFFKTDVIVAVTGLTTAGGSETKVKPVGTMFVHIILPNSEVSDRTVFKGSPEEIILQAIDRTAFLITSNL